MQLEGARNVRIELGVRRKKDQECQQKKGANKNITNGKEKGAAMITEVSDQEKVLFVRRKAAFLVFSHLHYSFNLKIATPYIAFQIFCAIHCHPDMQYHPPSILHCVSIYLAMKYQEIYPPTLRQIRQARNWAIDVTVYKRVELKVLTIMGANLNISTWWLELLEEMGQAGQEQDMMARLLLQVSLVTPAVLMNYSREKIIQAIVVLCKNKSHKHLSPVLTELCKVIVLARTNLPHSCPFIYQKYSKPQYLSVSWHPLQHSQLSHNETQQTGTTDQ